MFPKTKCFIVIITRDLACVQLSSRVDKKMEMFGKYQSNTTHDLKTIFPGQKKQ